ncbi:MAG: hypothetical protein VKL39_13110 [Leptolyngbyaceae bacterium]|nr:hypothetical protein [Leptolyngbyaceae bacterium]
MLWLLVACAEWDGGDGPDTGVEGTGTGTLTVDPDLAVTDIEVVQVGPDLQVSLRTATPVSRLVDVRVTWAAGVFTHHLVSVEGGEGVGLVELPDPCEQVGTTLDLTLKADGLTWDRSVDVVGAVFGFSVPLDPFGLVVSCEPDAFLSAQPTAYYLRAAAGFLEGTEYNTVQGAIAWTGTTGHFLDGSYNFVHREPPFVLSVWPLE